MKKVSKLKNNKEYITLLSVLSMISVVILHTNGCFWNYSNGRYWFTANIIESIFYFAVPIFFMITGVTLLDYRQRYSTKEYFKKRFFKTFLPFIVWSIIGLLFRILYVKDININQLNFSFIWNGIFNSEFISIYRFFIPLFIIYLFIPILSAVDDKYKKKIYIYIVLFVFIINSLLPFILKLLNSSLITPISLTIGNTFVEYGNVYIIYPLIGYLLDKYEIKCNKIVYLIYVLSIVGLLSHIIGTYTLSTKANTIIDTFKGYNNVPCILHSIGIFVFAKRISLKHNFKCKIIDFIGKYTFGIYLIHWYIMIFTRDIFSLKVESILYRLGLPFIVIPICILIIYIIRKVPVLNKIVP